MTTRNARTDLELRPVETEEDWTIGVVSMPLPKTGYHDVKIKGAKAQVVPVAWWPRTEKYPGGPRIPRRSLVFFQRPRKAEPIEAGVVRRARAPQGKTVSPEGWSVKVERLEDHRTHGDDKYFHYYYQPCEVVLTYKRKKIGLRLAIRNSAGTNVWQYVVSELLWEGPLCAAYRIGGHIYTGKEKRVTREELRKDWGGDQKTPDLTIQASLYLLIFADGTMRVTAHWINGRIYGGDGDQEGVPAVLFRNLGEKLGKKKVKWDGQEPVMEGATASLNLRKAAHLVSPEFPGVLEQRGEGLLYWQPVQDTTVRIRYSPVEGAEEDENGLKPVEKINVVNSEKGMVRGLARSVTWDMKFGGVPRIQRFLAPAPWYGKNQEFAPLPIKPREGKWTALSKYCTEQFKNNSVSGRFTSGGIFRYLDQYGKGCYELSMDANEARSLYRRAWWDGDPETYDLAERNAWFCADIAVDHVRDIIHYHGDPGHWQTYSSIYMRFSGLVLAYAETGDYYLLETAEAVARNYMSHHLQNWPRLGIGRDAESMVGLNILHDYTGDETYFQFARRFAGDVAAVIHKDGLWLAGSGVGPVMGCNAGDGGPWNGGHFFNGFTPWVARASDVPEEWMESARRGLAKLFKDLEKGDQGFHPAACGFMGGPHWYLACRLKDESLIRQVRKFMDNVLDYHEHGGRDRLFHGGRAHHMNNYIDYLLFWECTRETLPSEV